MPVYTDPESRFTLDYPGGWLPLTQEGSPHVSLASLTTGGCLKIETGEVFLPAQPEVAVREILNNDTTVTIRSAKRDGLNIASARWTGRESTTEGNLGHMRVWVIERGDLQVRCLYRCRAVDTGVDDDELEGIIDSLTLTTAQHLDAGAFTHYYYSLLKRHRPQLAMELPARLSLTLADGQTVLLEHLYNHYLQEPERMEELIEGHINLLDYCGDDVPDLGNYQLIKPLLFPKICRAGTGALPAYRDELWPGLALGAVIRGTVFNYGVNLERLKTWGFRNLAAIRSDCLANLHTTAPVAPRGLDDGDGGRRAISYVDHPFAASFLLFEDFYETTAHNLHARRFLVGLPDPSCLSCFRDDDPRFVVEHTAKLRWDYHRSVEKLTDTIYLVTGPRPHDIQPYDILHGCARPA